MDLAILATIEMLTVIVGSLALGIAAGMFFMEIAVQALESAAARFGGAVDPFPPAESRRDGQRVVSVHKSV